jgi:hypothetical protein
MSEKSGSGKTEAYFVAELHQIFASVVDKIELAAPDSPVIQELVGVVGDINASIEKSEELEKLLNWDVFDDIGTEASLPTVEMDQTESNEKKIIRMLSRCPSNSTLDSEELSVNGRPSVTGSNRPSIGAYRNSSALRDSIVRGTTSNAPAPVLYSKHEKNPSEPIGIVSSTSSDNIKELNGKKFEMNFKNTFRRKATLKLVEDEKPFLASKLGGSDIGIIQADSPESQRKRVSTTGGSKEGLDCKCPVSNLVGGVCQNCKKQSISEYKLVNSVSLCRNRMLKKTIQHVLDSLIKEIQGPVLREDCHQFSASAQARMKLSSKAVA